MTSLSKAFAINESYYQIIISSINIINPDFKNNITFYNSFLILKNHASYKDHNAHFIRWREMSKNILFVCDWRRGEEGSMEGNIFL